MLKREFVFSASLGYEPNVPLRKRGHKLSVEGKIEGIDEAVVEARAGATNQLNRFVKSNNVKIVQKDFSAYLSPTDPCSPIEVTGNYLVVKITVQYEEVT